MKKKVTVVGILVLLLVLVTVVQALTQIDTFNDTNQISDLTNTCTSASVPGTDIINSERDILVTRTTGGGTVVADVDSTTPDNFSLSIGASTRGTALIQWDGSDGNCGLNVRGLAPLSLSPDDGLAIYVRSVDLNGIIQMRVYSDVSNYSTYSYVIPTSITPPGRVLYFPFEQFTNVGTGADFTDVGAIEVLVDGTTVDSLDMTIDFVNSDLTRDFGDLPDAYNNITLLANNGARHILGPIYLGLNVDADADGQTSSNARGDDTDGTNDEQGVDPTTGSNWGDGSGAIGMHVVVPSGVACVVGWIDWDGSGSFDVGGTTGGVSELVYNNFRFNGGSSATITTPTAGAYGGFYPAVLNSRFRIFQPNADLFTMLGIPVDGFGCPTLPSAGWGGTATEAQVVQLLTGLARNGEVEDYQWGFSPTAVSLQSTSASTSSSTLLGLAAAFALTLVSAGALIYRRQTRVQ